MKKLLALFTSVGLGLLALPAQAQLVITAPIAESSSRTQIGHQGVMGTLKTLAKNLISQGVDQQKLTAELTDQNMNLHKEWYASLLSISSTVRNYGRVANIFENQGRIIAAYSANIGSFVQNPRVEPARLAAMRNGYIGLIKESGSMLDDLGDVLRPSHANMTDAQRIKAINRIDARMSHHVELVNYFTRRNQAITAFRTQESAEIKAIRNLYGLQ